MIGQTISHYRIVEQLGGGDSAARERFQREAFGASALN